MDWERPQQPAATADGRPTLNDAIRAALAEPEPEYNPWRFERSSTLWEAIGNEVGERIAQGEARRREVHRHHGYGDREPRAER